jgi:mRNA deadenylase 3'-5' endonuclease subunit Ccr4
MENQNFDQKEKRHYSNRNHDQDNAEHRHNKKPRYDRYKNQKFPFNLRHFVPEFQLENMHDNPDYIRVISYNILCDSLVSISTQIDESDLVNYPYMFWENRRKNILAELCELNGDVICIQEFERDEDFISALGKLGYDVKKFNFYF